MTLSNTQKTIVVTLSILLVVGLGYVGYALFSPLPKLTPTVKKIEAPKATTGTLAWPDVKQAALGADGYGVLATQGQQISAPIASIAKTMLALSVLTQKPLKAGEQGPTITMTDADVTLYKDFLAKNGSVVPVNLNEKLTEYQALQALLIPSGDNIADTLAIWAFGSVDNYLSFANKKAADLGLKQTHFADASGLDPQTVSSAQDLVMLGQSLLKEPAIAEIVNQPQVTLPVVGLVKNYDSLLGQENIIGIKTGNTDEAGGCFLFAAKKVIDGHEVTVIGALLGATNLSTVLHNTQSFLQTNTSLLHAATIVQADHSVGEFTAPWGFKSNIIPQDSISLFLLPGTNATITTDIPPLTAPAQKGDKVGTITVKAGSYTKTVPVLLSSSLPKPRRLWRLMHPLSK